MSIRADTGLTFDDVLLVPKRSAIHSRKDVSTSTWLVPGMHLSIPILSANMDTVTETRMAIAMALHGGLGLIHFNMAPREQLSEVSRLAGDLRIDLPLTFQACSQAAGFIEDRAQRDWTHNLQNLPTSQGFYLLVRRFHDLWVEFSNPLIQTLSYFQRFIQVHRLAREIHTVLVVGLLDSCIQFSTLELQLS